LLKMRDQGTSERIRPLIMRGRPKVPGSPLAENLAQVLAAAPKGEMIAAQFRHLRDEAVDLVVLVEEVALAALQGAEFAAEHAFAQEAVIVARPIEALLGAVVEAGDAHGGEVEAQYGLEVFVAVVDFIAAEAPLVVALAHLVVVIEQGDNVLAEPHM